MNELGIDTHLKLIVQALVPFGQRASLLDRVLDVLVGVEVLRVVPRGSILRTVRQLFLVVLFLLVDVVMVGGGRRRQQSRSSFVLREFRVVRAPQRRCRRKMD